MSAEARRLRRQEERAFATKVRGISSFTQLREMLRTATPAQAEVINARIANRERHRAIGNERRAREAAERAQVSRVHRD